MVVTNDLWRLVAWRSGDYSYVLVTYFMISFAVFLSLLTSPNYLCLPAG